MGEQTFAVVVYLSLMICLRRLYVTQAVCLLTTTTNMYVCMSLSTYSLTVSFYILTHHWITHMWQVYYMLSMCKLYRWDSFSTDTKIVSPDFPGTVVVQQLCSMTLVLYDREWGRCSNTARLSGKNSLFSTSTAAAIELFEVRRNEIEGQKIRDTCDFSMETLVKK